MKYPFLLIISLFAFTVIADHKPFTHHQSSTFKQQGADLFLDKCALCHGFRGLGEGTIPLLIQPYPNTNLAIINKADSANDLKKIISAGASLPHVNQYMPPFADELPEHDIDALIAFIQLLRKDLNASSHLINESSKKLKPSMSLGRASFKGRCSLCHGIGGTGNGRLSRLIKNPSPTNLTLSTQSERYLKNIIKNGGAAMGRSKSMPSWTHLSDVEIQSVVMYIKQLRQPQSNSKSL